MERLCIEPVPIELVWNEPERNLEAVALEIGRRLAARPEIPSIERLFLFPELTLTGFVTKNPDSFSLEAPDPVVDRLRTIAKEKQTALCAGFPEANSDAPGKPFNTMVLIGPDGKIRARYRKNHLFTLGENPESASYSAGQEGVLCAYRGWRIGFATCFDVRFSPLFHAYARENADLILVGACWVGGPHKTEQFRLLNAAHAVLGQCFVAAVNRAGKDPFFEYDGKAYVFSPLGADLHSGGPALLDPAVLAAGRKLAVRAADKTDYPVGFAD